MKRKNNTRDTQNDDKNVFVSPVSVTKYAFPCSMQRLRVHLDTELEENSMMICVREVLLFVCSFFLHGHHILS